MSLNVEQDEREWPEAAFHRLFAYIKKCQEIFTFYVNQFETTEIFQNAEVKNCCINVNEYNENHSDRTTFERSNNICEAMWHKIISKQMIWSVFFSSKKKIHYNFAAEIKCDYNAIDRVSPLLVSFTYSNQPIKHIQKWTHFACAKTRKKKAKSSSFHNWSRITWHTKKQLKFFFGYYFFFLWNHYFSLSIVFTSLLRIPRWSCAE